MAIVLYQNADITVPTISARNALTRKIDNMVVVVLDAIADAAAGPGVATYRWSKSLDNWILISKSSYDTIKFATEELLISGGSVTPSNIPTDNQIWGIDVLDGTNIIANLTMEGLTITPTSISGLAAWNGYKLRFTYAYGTISQQVDSYIKTQIASVIAGAPESADTFKELYDIIVEQGNGAGAIDDFEGALL